MKSGMIVINSFNESSSYLYQVKRLKEEFLKLNVNLVVKRTYELNLFISDGEISKLDVKYDFIIFYDKDISIARMLEKQGYRLFNCSDSIELCDNKMLTHIKLSNEEIDMPLTIPSLLCYKKDESLNLDYINFVESKIKYPLIFKECYGSLGKHVYLLKSHDELIDYLERFKTDPYLIQEFIKSSQGKDIRIIVIGNKVCASMIRENKNDFRSNIGSGGVGKKYEPSKELSDLSIKIVKILNLDYAGIDILFGENGKFLLCEVNSNAFFKEIEKICNVNVAYLYANYIYGKIYKR